MLKTLALATLGLLCSWSAAAQPINHYICRSADMAVVERSKALTIFSFDDKGLIVGRVEGESFHAMNSRCNGILRIQPDYRSAIGYCKYADRDGDAVHLEWRNAEGKQTWDFISGTGKWQGITGGGSYNVRRSGVRSKPQFKGTFQNCVHVTGEFTLPN